MGADNVDIFKKIIFSLPDIKKQIVGMILLSPLYAVVAYTSFDFFTPIEAHIIIIPIFALTIYLIPFMIAGELFYQLLPDYPRKWSYFLSLTNQFVLFIYSLILSGADDVGNGWSIFWLGIITICLINVFVLIMSNGIKWYKRIIPLSFTQPLIILVTLQLIIGQYVEIAAINYIFSFSAVIISLIFLLVLIKLVDYLIASNTNVSAFRLTSGLLKNKQEALELGYEARPDIQVLQIENDEKMTIAAPWVHPGPLGGFGGGKLSNRIIKTLNTDSSSGFFLHVPCTHKEDLADPKDVKKIEKAISKPEKNQNASKMIKKEHSNYRFFGRKIGNQKIVYLDADDIDDYDTAIFMKDIDKENVLLVDLHNHDIHEGPEKEVQHGTKEAEKLKDDFDRFLNRLDSLELSEYRAGFEAEQAKDSMMALVEEIDDQRTLTLGIDTNGVTQDMRELRKEYQKDYDFVLLFSTDTHSSIYDLAKQHESDVDKAIELIEEAADKVKDASIGITKSQTESLKLLKLDYNGLVFSINILIRLTVISLIFFYIILIIWIF